MSVFRIHLDGYKKA
ncbi:TPA: hypothetical protein ACYZYK_003066 [Escherichia coli]